MHCTAERVKGKRVQIPHDLVTVIRESASGCIAPATGAFALGRRCRAAIFQSGNLPAVGTGVQTPDHEELVVPKSPETTEVFLSCHPQDRRASSFISLSCTLCLVQTAIYPAGKEKTHEKDRNQEAGCSCYGSGPVRRCAHRLRRCCFQHGIQHRCVCCFQRSEQRGG